MALEATDLLEPCELDHGARHRGPGGAREDCELPERAVDARAHDQTTWLWGQLDGRRAERERPANRLEGPVVRGGRRLAV